MYIYVYIYTVFGLFRIRNKTAFLVIMLWSSFLIFLLFRSWSPCLVLLISESRGDVIHCHSSLLSQDFLGAAKHLVLKDEFDSTSPTRASSRGLWSNACRNGVLQRPAVMLIDPPHVSATTLTGPTDTTCSINSFFLCKEPFGFRLL